MDRDDTSWRNHLCVAVLRLISPAYFAYLLLHFIRGTSSATDLPEIVEC